jgi:hypothetical protein
MADEASSPPVKPGAAALAPVRSWLRPGPTTSRKRWAIALTIALAADALQLAIWPVFAEGAVSPFDDALDAVVACLLLAVLGFRWRLAIALGMELVPGAALFPTWSAVVASVAVEPKKLPAPRAPESNELVNDRQSSG